jgi:hypothetical protein
MVNRKDAVQDGSFARPSPTEIIMHYRGLRRLVGIVFGAAAVLLLGGCGPNKPGPQDDVVVHAPGVVATSDDQGVSVKAPLVDVKVGGAGVSVNAPGVAVKVDSQGVSVDAPLGVTVRTGETKPPAT